MTPIGLLSLLYLSQFPGKEIRPFRSERTSVPSSESFISCSPMFYYLFYLPVPEFRVWDFIGEVTIENIKYGFYFLAMVCLVRDFSVFGSQQVFKLSTLHIWHVGFGDHNVFFSTNDLWVSGVPIPDSFVD